MKKITCIYKITCLANGKIYIGSAVNFHGRKRQHFQFLRLKKHRNSHLQFAYNLFGEESFVFEIVELVSDKNNLIEREQHWLSETQCFNRTIGFNICMITGSSLGVKRSDEFKEKIKVHNLNRPQEVKDKNKAAVRKANVGKISWNKGLKMWDSRPHPKGTLGKKFLNRKFTQEGYKKICESNRKPRNESYKQLRSYLSSKNYYFICPTTGAELKIDNLKIFCQKNNLSHSRMYQVANGNEPHHKGWIRDDDCYVNPN